MANRYWVGGTGTWDASSTTHWSTTSGGVGGASAPNIGDAVTVGDTVIFDANSGGGTVTYSVAGGYYWGGLDTTGFTGTLALGSNRLGFRNSLTANVTFGASSTVTASPILGELYVNGMTVNLSAGTPLPRINLQGTLNLYSAITIQSGFSIDGAGTLNTNGFNITFTGRTNNDYLSPTVGLNIGASTITAGHINIPSTFSQSGSTLNVKSLSIASNVTLGTVNFDYQSDDVQLTGAGTLTCTNLTRASTSPLLYGIFNCNTNLVVTGTLTLSSNSATNRLRFNGKADVGRTINATNVVLTNVDFSNTSFTAAKSGTKLGDRGGNTNITFAAARTLYANGGAWDSPATWSLSAGGATGVSPPLPQDSVVTYTGQTTFVANAVGYNFYLRALTLGNGTITVGSTSYTNNLVLSGGLSKTGSGVLNFAYSSSGSLYFQGNSGSTSNVNVSSGWTSIPPYRVSVTPYFGNITVQSFASTGVSLFSVVASSTATYTATLTSVDVGSQAIEIIGQGSGTVAIPESASLSCYTLKVNKSSGGTFACDNTSNVYLAANGGLYLSNDVSWKLNSTVYFNGTGFVDSAGTSAGYARSLAETGQITSLKVVSGFTLTVDNWAISGSSQADVVELNTISGAGSFNLVYGAAGKVNTSYMTISHCAASPASTWYAKSSTDGGSNSGWIFEGTNNLFFGSNF